MKPDSTPNGWRRIWRHKAVRRTLIGLGVFCALGLVGLLVVSPKLTPWLEGKGFREMLDHQTSKGLNFSGTYGPIIRTGFSTAFAKEFQADDGVKAMRSLEAENISGKFNPWGVFLRRWQLDYVHIQKGSVRVQTYEPVPKEKKPRPWYAFFLPDRVYLGEVTCEDANVTWMLKDKEGGIFSTRVKILPHGRDFEYLAEGGVFRLPGILPEHDLKRSHLLITKKILQVYALELVRETAYGKEKIAVEGSMGMGATSPVDMKLKVENMPVAQWIPKSLKGEVRGSATGGIVWTGENPSLEASSGSGSLKVSGAELNDLQILDFLAAATAKKSFRRVKFSSCQVEIQWKYPEFEVTSLDLQSDGKLAFRGSVQLSGDALSGTVELGLAPEYLEWLPDARRDIFNHDAEGLAWTTVKLSGTLEKPENDLSPRLVEQLKRHPGAAAGLLLRGAGEWIKQKLTPD